MKYGAVTVQKSEGVPVEINTTGEDIAYASHQCHFISLIGWDDDECVWLTKDSASMGIGRISYDNKKNSSVCSSSNNFCTHIQV